MRKPKSFIGQPIFFHYMEAMTKLEQTTSILDDLHIMTVILAIIFENNNSISFNTFCQI